MNEVDRLDIMKSELSEAETLLLNYLNVQYDSDLEAALDLVSDVRNLLGRDS